MARSPITTPATIPPIAPPDNPLLVETDTDVAIEVIVEVGITVAVGPTSPFPVVTVPPSDVMPGTVGVAVRASIGISNLSKLALQNAQYV